MDFIMFLISLAFVSAMFIIGYKIGKSKGYIEGLNDEHNIAKDFYLNEKKALCDKIYMWIKKNSRIRNKTLVNFSNFLKDL